MLAAAENRARWRRLLATIVRAVILVVSVAALFTGGLLGAGTLMHALRGPHQHPPCHDTRGTCTPHG